jgi:integrase
MAENKLTMKRVLAAKTPGYLSDGGGLHLQVTVNKAGAVNKSWVYRFLIHGRSREMGLGPLSDTFSLAEARAERNRWRKVKDSGRDPIEERERQKHSAAMEAAHTTTFQEATETFMKTNKANDRWRAKATADDWESEFNLYAMPVLASLPIRDIGPGLIDKVLEPIWRRPVLGRRLRSRLEELFDWAAARGYRAENSNPCLYKRVSQSLGKRGQKHQPKHYTAIGVDDIGAFVIKLRERQAADPADLAHFAIEFAVLCAVRIGTVRWARWQEIDLEKAVWTIPGPQNKSGRDFRIPLPQRAVTILKSLPGAHEPDNFLFPGQHPSSPTGRNTFRIVAKRLGIATLHGVRSTFRDWGETRTNFAARLLEAALDHVRGDRTMVAYQRDDLLMQRRPVMEAWARFVDKPAPAKVVPISPHAVAAR